MIRKVYITLDEREASALSKLAEMEVRDPRAQARLIIRGELERRGLLPGQQHDCPELQPAPADGRGYGS